MDDNPGTPESQTTEPAGGNPTPEPTSTTPEAAPGTAPALAPEPTTHPDAAEPTGRRNRGADVQDYEERRKQALETPAVEPEGEASTPGEPAATPEPDPVPAAEAPETDDGGDEVKVPEKIRLGGLSKKSGALVTAAILLAKSEGLEFEEAFARLKGTPPAAPAAQDAEPATQGRTIEQIEAEISALDAVYDEAGKNIDTLKMAELRKQERTLNRELGEAQNRAREIELREHREFSQTVETSKAQTLEAYPDAGVEGSEFANDMVAMADLLESQGNPIVFEPDAPFSIAQMVGNARGIAPKQFSTKVPKAPSKSSTSASLRPQPVPQRAVGRPATPVAAPASGSARTTPPGPPAPPFGNIRTVEDYNATLKKLGVSG